jgi:hypothetical protein
MTAARPAPRAIARWVVGDWLNGSMSGDYAGLEARIATAIEADRAGAPWRCFHCGFATTDDTAARAHFGDSDAEPAACRGRWMDFHAVRAENAELRARIAPPAHADQPATESEGVAR